MRVIRFIVIVATAMVWAQPGIGAQTSGGATSQPAAAEGDDLIQLTFPKNSEISMLVEYVSKRLDINILYSESVGRKKVTINSPARVPESSLMGLLQSVLRMAGLTIVDAEQPGWKKIVPDKDLLAITSRFRRDGEMPAEVAAMTPITQVFQLRHAEVAAVEKSVKPLLSKPGGNTLAVDQRRLLIVTDYAGNLRRVAEMIRMVDQPGKQAVIQFVPVRNRDAEGLAQQVTGLLSKKAGLASGKPRDSQIAIVLTAEPRTNQIILICPEGEASEALKLIGQLDVARRVETRSYTLRHVAPTRVDKLARELAGDKDRKLVYESTIDAESGRLFVTAPQDVHDRIALLVRELDVPPDQETVTYRLKYIAAARIDRLVRELAAGEAAKGVYRSVIDEESGMRIVADPKRMHQQIEAFARDLDVAPDETTSPIRFYQLMNTTAAEVLATIQSLTGEAPSYAEPNSRDTTTNDQAAADAAAPPAPLDPASANSPVHALSGPAPAERIGRDSFFASGSVDRERPSFVAG